VDASNVNRLSIVDKSLVPYRQCSAARPLAL
jgi:hypothetical protein